MRLRFGLREGVVAIVTVSTVALGLLFVLDRRAVFLPGRTSDGHHLVETHCGSCHVGFAAVPNARCVACHKAELADDIHPVRLFEDPRWAESLEKLDARRCVACHREHVVSAGGVTVPRDFCVPCHDDVADKRVSHRNLAPETCGNAGCHNYHDNTALNPAFLRKQRGQLALRLPGALPQWAREIPAPSRPLEPDHPAGTPVGAEVLTAWRASAHAAMAVNCMDCHAGKAGFVAHPSEAACERCHRPEVATFRLGKHGVRTALGLSAVDPGLARLPMKRFAGRAPRHSCAACHDPHRLDTRRAAVDACLGCHDDRHSRAFAASRHAALAGEPIEAGRVAPGEVTCATCHLPRARVETERGHRIVVNHDNSLTMRPRDRMAKTVCLACHGFEFALASLLDERLVATNFQGRPEGRPDTFRMIDALVAEEASRHEERKGAAR